MNKRISKLLTPKNFRILLYLGGILCGLMYIPRFGILPWPVLIQCYIIGFILIYSIKSLWNELGVTKF